jgi:hypothetical protein
MAGTVATPEIVSEPTSSPDAGARRSARVALLVFVAVLAGALVLYVIVGHKYYWFYLDEWDFLAKRDGGNISDLLRPHNEHWSTAPIIVYRILWRLFGMRSYVPYQSVVIALHLTAAILLRVVMRRAGSGPWIATACASMFVLLGGAAWQNIVWAFQIGFVGSLVCGLAQLILADHDGRIDRRDVIGLGFGVVGLLCSGVAVTMVIVVGIAAFVRRGWRAAAFQTAPLGVLFVAWWLKYGRSAYRDSNSSPGYVVHFVAHGLRNAFDRIAEVQGTGALLFIILVVGLALAWAPLSRAELRRTAAMPGAMLVGTVVFMSIAATGRGREFGIVFSERWRYVHILVALIAPGLAVAGQAIAQRWRVATPLLAVLLLIGVPTHLSVLRQDERTSRDPLELSGTGMVGDPGTFLAFANSPALARAAPSFRPFHGAALIIDVGWMREGRASGRIPDADPPPRKALLATLVLGLRQSNVPIERDECQPFAARVEHLDAGDTIDFDGALLIRAIDGRTHSGIIGSSSAAGSRLTAFVPMTLDIAPYPGADSRECKKS